VVFRRRLRFSTPAALAAEGAAFDALAEPLRRDVQTFIDPTWNVNFRHADSRWWFDINDFDESNGSFNGSLIEVAVYVEEYLRDSARWPRCSEHREPVRIVAAGRTSVVWVCPGPPRHDAAVGHLDALIG